MAPCTTCGTSLNAHAVYCPRCGARVEGTEERDDYVYEAFLSYRHLPRDRSATVGLQKRLEGMHIPKGVRPTAERRRLGRLFRDEDELPTSGSLSNQIQEALCQSRFLIVVASPQTEESLWVRREIEFFAEQHGRDHILVALAEGEIGDSLPSLLATRLVKTEEGEVIEVADEPLAADLTGSDRGRLRTESLRIAAALIGCGYDGLRQRMALRRTQVAAAIAAGIAAASIGFGSYALHQERRLAASYQQTQRNESELLARESAALLAEGDRMGAIQTALEALPESSVSTDRPYVPAAQLALEQALDIYPSPDYWHVRYAVDEVLDQGAVSEDGLVAVMGTDSRVHVDSLETGAELCSFDPRALLDVSPSSLNGTPSLVFCDEKLLVSIPFEGGLGAFDPTTGELLWHLEALPLSWETPPVPLGGDSHVAFVSSDSPSKLGLEEADGDAFFNDANLLVVDTTDGSITDSLVLHTEIGFGTCALEASEDGRYVAVARSQQLFIVNLDTREVAEVTPSGSNVRALSFVGDTLVCISGDHGTSNYLNGEHFVECFQTSGDLLWSFKETLEVQFDSHGSERPCCARIVGTWEGEGFEGTQLVILMGRSVVFVDPQTGLVTYRSVTPTPALDVFVSRDGGPLGICCGGGEVLYRLPKPDSGEAGYPADMSMGGDEITRATFVRYHDDPWLIAWSESTHRMRALRYTRTDSDSRTTLVRESSGYYLDWSEDGFVVTDEDGIVFLNPDTFQERWSVPLSSLDALDSTKLWDADIVIGNRFVYACGKPSGEEDPEGVYIYALDSLTGDVVDSFLLTGEDWGTFHEISTCGPEETLLLAHSTYDLMLYDTQTHQSLCTVQRDSFIESAWPGDGTVVLAVRENDTDSVDLVSTETGESLSCDFSTYRPTVLTTIGCSTFVSEDATQAVMACDDGTTRLFSTADGSIVWESPDAPSDVQKVVITDGGNVLVQDTSGHCMLLDGTDGRMIAYSRTEVPALTSTMRTNDPQVIMGFYRIPGMKSETGIVLISLDPEAFGPLSVVFEGLSVSSDGKLVLLRDSVHYRLVSLPYYSLDELIAEGEEQLASSGREGN